MDYNKSFLGLRYLQSFENIKHNQQISKLADLTQS